MERVTSAHPVTSRIVSSAVVHSTPPPTGASHATGGPLSGGAPGPSTPGSGPARADRSQDAGAASGGVQHGPPEQRVFPVAQSGLPTGPHGTLRRSPASAHQRGSRWPSHRSRARTGRPVPSVWIFRRRPGGAGRLRYGPWRRPERVRRSSAGRTRRRVRGRLWSWSSSLSSPRSESGSRLLSSKAIDSSPTGASVPVSSFSVVTDRVRVSGPATHEAPVPSREVFEVSTHRHRSLIGSLSCRTRPAPRAGRVGHDAHRHPWG